MRYCSGKYALAFYHFFAVTRLFRNDWLIHFSSHLCAVVTSFSLKCSCQLYTFRIGLLVSPLITNVEISPLCFSLLCSPMNCTDCIPHFCLVAIITYHLFFCCCQWGLLSFLVAAARTADMTITDFKAKIMLGPMCVYFLSWCVWLLYANMHMHVLVFTHVYRVRISFIKATLLCNNYTVCVYVCHVSAMCLHAVSGLCLAVR